MLYWLRRIEDIGQLKASGYAEIVIKNVFLGSTITLITTTSSVEGLKNVDISQK